MRTMCRLFLEDEDRRISAAVSQNRPKNGKEAVATDRVHNIFIYLYI